MKKYVPGLMRWMGSLEWGNICSRWRGPFGERDYCYGMKFVFISVTYVNFLRQRGVTLSKNDGFLSDMYKSYMHVNLLL